MKLIFRSAALFLFAVSAFLLIPSCQSTYLGRWVAWNFSDIEDYQKFPKRDVHNQPPVFNFPVAIDAKKLKHISYTYKKNRYSRPTDEFIDGTETTALIVIRNDTIILEGYGNGYTRSSINTSFSVAKSITSLLVGIAVDEGRITHIQQSMADYIPELVTKDPKLRLVTISNLLMMQSGFYYRDHDLVWGDKPKNYYHPCLRARALSVRLDEPPGERWQYMGYNPILCGIILERVTKTTVSEYFEKKVWAKLGMEFPASWSLDSDDDQLEKMESGVNGRAIDFAKLGRLMLNKGNWNGEQVVSQTWVEDCTSLEGSVRAWEGVHYKNFWWIYLANDRHPQSFAGTGHLGQFIFVSPAEKIVIVRFGKDTGKIDSWIDLFREMASSHSMATISALP